MRVAFTAVWLAAWPAQAHDFETAIGLSAPRFERVREGFYLPGVSPQAVAHAARAVVELQTNFWRILRLEHPRRCSGTYISQEGHVLTAAHCVLEELTLLQRTAAGEERVWDHGADVVRYGEGVARMMVGGSLLGSRARIEAAGRGMWLPADLLRFKDDPAALERQRAIYLGDWAILKVETGHATPCVPAADEPPAAGDRIWLYGYAGRAYRQGGPGTNGLRLAMTEGVVLRDVTQAVWYRADGAALAALYSAFLQPAIDAGDLIISDADGNVGMSGGAAFDRHGRITGVFYLGWRNSAYQYQADLAQVVSVKKIRGALRSAGLDPALYFSCPAAGRPAPRI